MLTPEQQLRNVARVAMEYTEKTRLSNGKGRTSVYPANKDAIAGTARQLAEMIVLYLDGKLEAIPESDLPF